MANEGPHRQGPVVESSNSAVGSTNGNGSSDTASKKKDKGSSSSSNFTSCDTNSSGNSKDRGSSSSYNSNSSSDVSSPHESFDEIRRRLSAIKVAPQAPKPDFVRATWQHPRTLDWVTKGGAVASHRALEAATGSYSAKHSKRTSQRNLSSSSDDVIVTSDYGDEKSVADVSSKVSRFEEQIQKQRKGAVPSTPPAAPVRLNNKKSPVALTPKHGKANQQSSPSLSPSMQTPKETKADPTSEADNNCAVQQPNSTPSNSSPPLPEGIERVETEFLQRLSEGDETEDGARDNSAGPNCGLQVSLVPCMMNSEAERAARVVESASSGVALRDHAHSVTFSVPNSNHLDAQQELVSSQGPDKIATEQQTMMEKRGAGGTVQPAIQTSESQISFHPSKPGSNLVQNPGLEGLSVEAMQRLLVQKEVELQAERVRIKALERAASRPQSVQANPQPSACMPAAQTDACLVPGTAQNELRAVHSQQRHNHEERSVELLIRPWMETEEVALRSALNAALRGYKSAVDKAKRLEDALAALEAAAEVAEMNSKVTPPIAVDKV